MSTIPTQEEIDKLRHYYTEMARHLGGASPGGDIFRLLDAVEAMREIVEEVAKENCCCNSFCTSCQAKQLLGEEC